ncbi:zinc finger CCCH domain-containing protein 14 [Boleophthalmus pectinirostris]|uniref:zinc finger CCCH domain-containing protein 14 n=1 Tax=Boleophthalmus pectinirostris TaxID=150288 RepID=UPI00242A6599|nr:zinc finger CCCH domain-containing protein 14 [Boleophthalmus pectinirostris]
MEIGTEISKKIRAAIKGKLQELGAYIDEELPDYIMVMVANKKTSQQMADDLSLFLGSNTIKFTAWLHGVLEKLRSVAVEPGSSKNQLESDGGTSAGRRRSSEGSRFEESKQLTVSSSRSEARVSSSAYENRRGSSSRLTSAVKPLVESVPSEAVIDIKPDMDDDLISENHVETGTSSSRTRSSSSRPSIEIYRPSQSKLTSVSSAESYSRHVESRGSRSSRSTANKPEESRKRKAPVASSVVRVSRTDEDSDDVEDDDTNYGSRGLSSRVSLPSKAERKPSLPPAKQANRNLILKAISEAQDSITKTTAYPPIPQRQTVPVAPRTRLSTSEEMTAAIQLVQEHLHSLAPRAYASTELPQSRTAPPKPLALRLQMDSREGGETQEQSEHGPDTRSFIMSRPQLEEQSAVRPLQDISAVSRTVQSSKESGESASPKFIVTLDGVPSPVGNFTGFEMDMDDVRPPPREGIIESNSHPSVSVLQRLQGNVLIDDEMMDYEEMDTENIPTKRQKVLERCKFWPACKSGDECPYHHPTSQCKTFPNCKFGDKCLFIHPNCKYDARCTKPDCPFTHVSRRSTSNPPPRPVAPMQTTTVCRFFPDCKKMDCPFYHPKPCRFAAQCKRVGCSFYHPTTSVPPRHALKWTKAQSS